MSEIATVQRKNWLAWVRGNAWPQSPQSFPDLTWLRETNSRRMTDRRAPGCRVDHNPPVTMIQSLQSEPAASDILRWVGVSLPAVSAPARRVRVPNCARGTLSRSWATSKGDPLNTDSADDNSLYDHEPTSFFLCSWWPKGIGRQLILSEISVRPDSCIQILD
jgi:hypothetical protein